MFFGADLMASMAFPCTLILACNDSIDVSRSSHPRLSIRGSLCPIWQRYGAERCQTYNLDCLGPSVVTSSTGTVKY
ncbi:hypothetical protein BD310DRAFT_920293 [Dichomitus squalens]|uniref:Secreted protein n=1 Tax=Dichomitus squalens TaxID=114155 RepID=A0A4Q9Q2T8_9APHY|nr:hypothetical protein BD310DRAFT_920293 [Dichomitus squalens]